MYISVLSFCFVFYIKYFLAPRRAKIYWLLLILLIILVLLMLLCVIILFARHRGQKYPVAEKERLHGREAKDRTFDEYGRM